MNGKAIGVWLSIALLGVVLYMLPAVMKQLFFMKEQFVSQIDSGEWKGQVLPSVGAVGSVGGHTGNSGHAGPAPNYLQNVPSGSKDFEVGGAGGNSLESQPASVEFGTDGLTPMQLQGMQMKRAPASGTVEGFDAAGPSPAPAPGTATAPAPAPGTASSPAPAPGAGAALAPAPTSCKLEVTYNPNGPATYTCDGKVIDTPKGSIPSMPAWLTSTTTKDGIDEDEAAIMNYWLSSGDKSMPSWVTDMASAETLTASEKKAFATWAKDNTPASNEIIKPTSSSSSSSSSSSASGSSSSSCKPACKPKTKCKAKPPTEAKQCKGPIDMGDYIRKDSIPCWACKL